MNDPRGAEGPGEEEQSLNGSTRGSGVRIMFRSTLIRVRALDSCNLSLPWWVIGTFTRSEDFGGPSGALSSLDSPDPCFLGLG